MNDIKNDKIYESCLQTMFHGECWYRVECCNQTVEFYDTKPTDKEGIRICPYCGNKIRIG